MTPVPVLVFARAPEPGRVKTRLIPVIGAEAAARLHARMTRHAVETALAAGTGPVSLWVDGAATHPALAALRDEFPVELRTQRGGDLGARMAQALGAALAASPAAVLIGTDCPERGAEDLVAAADALRGGADVVLGPAQDGGYVLIGARRVDARLFDGMPWGTDAVLGRTRARIASLGWRHEELVPRRDVDRPEDLATLDARWWR